MKIIGFIVGCLLFASTALAQQSHQPSNGLIFGNGTAYTGPTKPTQSLPCVGLNIDNQLVGTNCGGGGGASFSRFTRTVTGSVITLPYSSADVTTTEVTEGIIAAQFLPACTTTNQWYVVWETNASPGGYYPVFYPPTNWTLNWPLNDVIPPTCLNDVCGVPPTPNTTYSASPPLTDVYSFQCDLPNHIWTEEGFVPANAPANQNSGIGGTEASAQGTDSIFNVVNFGADPTYTNDSTAAIQAAETAACAAPGNTLFFPEGKYKTTFSIISNCQYPITWEGPGDRSAVIQTESQGEFPVILHESPLYLTGITNNAPILSTSLAPGPGSAINWGASSGQYYDLRDATQGNITPLNGDTQLSVEGFLNYAGGASNDIYIMNSNGGDLDLPNNVTSAIQIALQPGSPNKVFACLTTTGSGFQCTSGGGGSITAGTTYEFEASYDGSTLRMFEGIPGQTTTLTGSVSMTGTVVQTPGEVWALGDGPTTIGGEMLQSTNHWIGQLDSIRVSVVAQHTSTYTAPTAKFGPTCTGNCRILLNNTAQSDVLLLAVADGLPGPEWLPLYAYTQSGVGQNEHATFRNLELSGGNYNFLSFGALYTTLDHMLGGGAYHDAFKFYNNCYGAKIDHLTAAPFTNGESALSMVFNSGLVDADWLTLSGGYYSAELIDAGGTFAQWFLNPSSYTVADLELAATDNYQDYNIISEDVDYEGGGNEIPAKIWGEGSYNFVGGDFQFPVNVIQAAPAGGGAAMPITLLGGNAIPSGSPSELIHWAGSNPPLTPLTWINPTVNNGTLTTAGIPLCDNLAYCQAIADTTIVPQYTIAGLPTCSATKNVGALATIDNSDSACVYGSAPTHSSCTVGTNCYNCAVQCAATGSNTYSWIAY